MLFTEKVSVLADFLKKIDLFEKTDSFKEYDLTYSFFTFMLCFYSIISFFILGLSVTHVLYVFVDVFSPICILTLLIQE